MSMSPTNRTTAVREASNRTARAFDLPLSKTGQPMKVSDYYGEHAFGLQELRSRLNADDWKGIESVIEQGAPLTPQLATKIAGHVKDWAVSRGATHFTHWFQPQTEWTAEKHDSFLSFDENRKPIDLLSASFLMQSEPDASSFPSGGLRATHEARGYTIWDPTSPLFIMESGGTKYLCIPSVFIGYNGEFLDERGPLLKSAQVLSEKATKLLQLMGEAGVTKVITTLGPEQEYFAIDRAWYLQRPDLMMTGRTLIGARPPKGQQLEDHYFGSIPERMQAFMSEVEYELYRLGVPVKTRHNEVAPAQYETAPVFEEADVASDHNQLTMSILRRIAKKHDLEILLHEKPFAGINGSGKHCNWSMAAKGSKSGANLLEPGENPRENTRFLLFLMATLKGVHKHAGMLRAGIASAGNDHRLGANEAPPAIISAFLGQALSRILDEVESGGPVSNHPVAPYMVKVGIRHLPDFTKDTTDRNRTSPFAFTGNKFEFRAVGGSASTAFPVMLLNVAVADGIVYVTETLEAELKKTSDMKTAVMNVVRGLVKETKAIRFEGNGYSEEWVYEAEKRGLMNLRKTPEALAQLVSQTTIEAFTKLGVLNESDVNARYHVRLEAYIKRMSIEARTMLQMVDTMVLPSGFTYLKELTDGIASAKAAGVVAPQTEIANKVGNLLMDIQGKRTALATALTKTEAYPEATEQAKGFSMAISTAMDETRVLCDALENEISDSHWPLPRYREILFIS